MEAGKLNRQITIQIATKTRSTSGAETITWQTFKTVWAGIDTRTGNERYVNQQIVAESTHEITIRYCAGIKPTMRVLYGNRTFDILNVRDIEERHIEMRLTCKELS